MICFIRCDDRIIHGQVVTRWAQERKCDGIIAVNDAVASNPLLRQALKAAGIRTFVWTKEQFAKKMHEAEKSQKSYFVITKTLADMADLLVDQQMQVTVDVLNVGPQPAGEGKININKNCDLSKEDVMACQKISDAGYRIEYRIVPDSTLVTYADVKDKLKQAFL